MSRLALDYRCIPLRAGALSGDRVHQQRIIRVGPNHFASLSILWHPFTRRIQRPPRVLIFTELKDRCPDGQPDWQTQANSLLCQGVLIHYPPIRSVPVLIMDPIAPPAPPVPDPTPDRRFPRTKRIATPNKFTGTFALSSQPVGSAQRALQASLTDNVVFAIQ